MRNRIETLKDYAYLLHFAALFVAGVGIGTLVGNLTSTFM